MPRGELSQNQLVKRIKREKARSIVKAKKFRQEKEKNCFVLQRKYKNDTQIVIARAMNAIGLDRKKPEDKKARATIQRLGQKQAELVFQLKFFSREINVDSIKRQLSQLKERIRAIITETKGQKAFPVFIEAAKKSRNDLRAAHRKTKPHAS